MDIFDAIILGIIEGLTEFLPISSTGHLILAGKILSLKNDDFLKTFMISIQLGAILSVIFLMRGALFLGVRFYAKILISFVPTGIIGFFCYKIIREFFHVKTVAIALIIGGVAFILLEIVLKNREKISGPPRKNSLEKITFYDAFLIGLSQCLAMIPGTSRSGATIFAGLILGLSREMAAKFSFILAIPTMSAATGYSLLKNVEIFTAENAALLGSGAIFSFFTALFAIKFFLFFVQKFSYTIFGLYRIILGAIFLIFI